MKFLYDRDQLASLLIKPIIPLIRKWIKLINL